jgi:hypothetical protein
MKRSQIILFSVFLVLTGLIYFALSSNKKEYSKKTKTEATTLYLPISVVKNQMRHLEIISYGQITPNSELIVSFEVQGKLQKGKSKKTLKPGVKFSKGEVLYSINNEEAFFALSARKSSLSNLILNALPDIELDFPSEKKKWIKFMNDLDPGKLLPELPRISSGKEKMFLTSRNILAEYYNLKSSEAQMEKYFYIAPFYGTVVEVYSEPGSIVNPGAQVAKIAKTGDYEVKVPIDLKDVELFKSKNTAEFTDASGKTIGTGKIIRVSDVINQQTQSADAYYTIKSSGNTKIYHGLFVNVKINKEATKKTVALPRVAVKNNIVRLLDGDKLKDHEVLIVGSKPDSLFVSGLKDGMQVVLEQVEATKDNIKYEGIKR